MVSLTGGDSAWGLTEHLLAAVVDSLQVSNWQRAGKKNAPKPKPVQRPGLPASRETETIGGGTKYTPDEMRALLDRHTKHRDN